MLERIFKIGSFRRLQRHEARFVKQVHLEETREKIQNMLDAENEEHKQATTREERMCEVADMAFLLTRMAELDGYSLKDAINSKIRRNNDKYNPRALRRLQRDWGMTPDESMAFAKQRWDRDRDKSYFT